MSVYPSFDALLGLTFGGVTLHNALQYVVKRFTAPVTKLAADVESGNVKSLEHDAKGVVDFVQTHDPALAKAVESEAAKLKAEALAEVEKARHAAADELRKLAESVEKASGATAPVVAPAAPVAVPVAVPAPVQPLA
jgi:hypothetical protein